MTASKGILDREVGVCFNGVEGQARPADSKDPTMTTMTEAPPLDIVIVYNFCDSSGACLRAFTPTERGSLDAETEANYHAAFGPGCEWHTTTTPYRLVETNAPDAYDYGYTVDFGVEQMTPRSGIVRTVGIPVERVEYQCGRYQSGCYFAKLVAA